VSNTSIIAQNLTSVVQTGVMKGTTVPPNFP